MRVCRDGGVGAGGVSVGRRGRGVGGGGVDDGGGGKRGWMIGKYSTLARVTCRCPNIFKKLHEVDSGWKMFCTCVTLFSGDAIDTSSAF